MKNKFTTKIPLTFSNIFPDEEREDIKVYLDGISRSFLLKLGAFFLGFDKDNSKYSDPFIFLRMFFSNENIEFHNDVIVRLHVFLDSNDKFSIENIEIPYEVSSLNFFEYVYDNIENETQAKSNEESEINIFKAYLILNDINTTKYNITVDEVRAYLPVHKRASAILLALHLHNYDLTNYDLEKLFSTQLIRASMFFEFLEINYKEHVLIKEFNKYYNVVDYKDFLKKILPIVLILINKKKESHSDIIIEDNEESKISSLFLDKLIINDLNVIGEFDFKNIRANPIYKIEENRYRLISPLFAMEMLYNGLFWKFKEINEKLPKPEQVKNFYNIKTFDFSEKFVFNKVLKEYYGKRFFQKSGEELDDYYEGAPDYYVRNGNKIFIYESKDIMLNAEVKNATSFKTIENSLKEKLYQKEDGTSKAIKQLINNVEKILSKQLKFDDNYKVNNVIVNPILVLHYRMFNIGGLNKFLNFWFQEELDRLSKNGLNVKNVKPLVVIDIDSLIYHKDVFSKRKLEFEDCLIDYQNNYINFSVKGKKFKSEEEMINSSKTSFIPFSLFLSNKISSEGYGLPPQSFIDKAYSLFDK